MGKMQGAHCFIRQTVGAASLAALGDAIAAPIWSIAGHLLQILAHVELRALADALKKRLPRIARLHFRFSGHTRNSRTC